MQQIGREIAQVALTSLLSLAAMFLFTRLGGKRQIAQMSPFDYLNAVTVGSIAAEMATNLEAWYRPLTALIVYGVVTWGVEHSACKSVALRTFWSGRAVILMQNGVIRKESLRRAMIDLNEFLGQARIARLRFWKTTARSAFCPKAPAARPPRRTWALPRTLPAPGTT